MKMTHGERTPGFQEVVRQCYVYGKGGVSSTAEKHVEFVVHVRNLESILNVTVSPWQLIL